MADNDLPDIIPLGGASPIADEFETVYDPDSKMVVRRRSSRAGGAAGDAQQVVGNWDALTQGVKRDWYGETKADLAGDFAKAFFMREEFAKLPPLSQEEEIELASLKAAPPRVSYPSGPYMPPQAQLGLSDQRRIALERRKLAPTLLPDLDRYLQQTAVELQDVNKTLAQNQGVTRGAAEFNAATGWDKVLAALKSPVEVAISKAAESAWTGTKISGLAAGATAATVLSGGGALAATAAGLGTSGALSANEGYDQTLLAQLIKMDPMIVNDPKGFIEAFKKNPKDYRAQYEADKTLALKSGLVQGAAEVATAGALKFIPGAKSFVGKAAQGMGEELAEEFAAMLGEKVVKREAVTWDDVTDTAVSTLAGTGMQNAVTAGGSKIADKTGLSSAVSDLFRKRIDVNTDTLTPMAPRQFSMMPQTGPTQMAVDLNTLTPTTPLQVGPQPQLFVDPSSLRPADALPNVIPLSAPQAGATSSAGADSQADALPDVIPLSGSQALPAAASRNDQAQAPAATQPTQTNNQAGVGSRLAPVSQPQAPAPAPRANPLAPLSGVSIAGAGEGEQNVIPTSAMKPAAKGYRLVEVDPRRLNDENQRTSTMSVRDPKNVVSRGGRSKIELAKDFIKAGVFDGSTPGGRPEAAMVGFTEDGKISITDGRHRLAAAEQLGAPRVTIQVPEAQADEFARRFAPAAPAGARPTQGGVASAFQPQAGQQTAPQPGQAQPAQAQGQGQRPVSLAPVNNTNVTNPKVGMPSARPMSVRDQAAWDALERKGMELDRRRSERRAKFEKDTNPATRRRGNEQIAQSLINNLRRGGSISHQEATAALRIVEGLMERGYLDNLAVSVSDADRGGGVRGEYNATAELVKLFVRNNERSGILRRTFAHEVSHHLERMIPAKDLEAARQQFLSERAKWLKDKGGLRQLLGEGNWIDKSFTNEQIKQFLASNTMNPALINEYFIRDTKNGNWRLKLTDETYQFTNFSEYFAEKVANLAVARDEARYNPQSGPGVWAKIKDMLAEIKKALIDVFGKDKVEAIWDRFQEGEYTSDFKRDKLQGYDNTGGQNPVMDDLRTADYRNPRFGEADQDRKERVDRIDKLEPDKVFSAEDQSKIDDMRFAGESLLEESSGSTAESRRDEQVDIGDVAKDEKKSGKVAGATLYISSRMLEGASFDEAFGEVVEKYGDSFSKFRDTVQQTTKRIAGMPISEAFKEAEKLASTRYPTAVGALEDPNKRNLISGLATILADPQKTARSAAELRKIVGFKQDKSWDDQRVISEFIKHVEGNLDWLYKGMRDKLPQGILDRSKLWYVGANAIANRLAKKHSISPEAAAGVLAVLSPQMDWYKNVSLAERALEIVVNKKNHVVDQAMVDAILERPSMVKLFMAIHEAKIYGDKFEQKQTKWPNKGDFSRDSKAAKALQAKLMAQAIPILRKSGVIPVGTKMGDVKDARLYAYLLRAYDEAYNPREYAVITPEGGTAGMAMNNEGTETKDVGWGNFDIIEKVRPLVENPTMENISRLMGGEHKVRNFYNNIIDPNARQGQVTIDTHAVAAGLLEPLAGSDKEVGDNLGDTGGSNYTGLSGLYPIYAQAYQNTARKYGLLPREMQSITWEAVRGLFTEKFKNATNKSTIKGLWAEYASGKRSLASVRSKIEKTAGGFKPPTWYGRDGQSPEGVGSAQDQGDVDPRGVREGRSRPGSGRAGKGPEGSSVKSARDEGNYHAGQADAKREQLRRLMATMERLEKERDRAEGRDGGPGESNVVKLTKARDDVKDIYKRIDALKKSIGDDDYFAGQSVKSARDDGENTPIPGGYREAFFKAKKVAGAPEPKQIKWWTDVGHDFDADQTKQFLWAIDKAGRMHVVSVSDLRDVLHEYGYENRDGQYSESDSPTNRDYSKNEGVTHLDWESLANFGEMDDTPVEGVTYDLLKGPAHGRIDATGDVVRISMVQKNRGDPALKADMRDYVKGKLADSMGIEPDQARGYDFTDAGPFNGPEVFSARDEEGSEIPRPSRPGSYKAFDEMVTGREIAKPEDMPYPYQMNRFIVLSPASKTARSNLEGYHLVQQGSDNGPQGRNDRREFRAVSKEVDPISGEHPTYRILFQFAQSGSRGSKGSVFVTTADDVSDPPDHVKIGLISELFERTRQAGLKDITIDKRYIGEMSPEDIGLWGHVAKNEPEISFDGDLNTYDIDKKTAYSARDEEPAGKPEQKFLETDRLFLEAGASVDSLYSQTAKKNLPNGAKINFESMDEDSYDADMYGDPTGYQMTVVGSDGEILASADLVMDKGRVFTKRPKYLDGKIQRKSPKLEKGWAMTVEMISGENARAQIAVAAEAVERAKMAGATMVLIPFKGWDRRAAVAELVAKLEGDEDVKIEDEIDALNIVFKQNTPDYAEVETGEAAYGIRRDQVYSARDEDPAPRKLKADPVVKGSGRDAMYPKGEEFPREYEDGGVEMYNILGRNKASPERMRQIEEFVKDSAVKHALYRGQNGAYETPSTWLARDGLIHLTDDPDYAAQYAESPGKRVPEEGTKHAIAQVYLNAENVLDLTRFGHTISDKNASVKVPELADDIYNQIVKINGGDIPGLRNEITEALKTEFLDHDDGFDTEGLTGGNVWRALIPLEKVVGVFDLGVHAIKYSDSDVRTARGEKRGGKVSYAINDPSRIKAAFGDNDVNPDTGNIFQSARDESTNEGDRNDAIPISRSGVISDKDGKPVELYRGQYGRGVGRSIQTKSGSITFSNEIEDARLYAKEPNNFDDKAEEPKILRANITIKNPWINSEFDHSITFNDILRGVGGDRAKAMHFMRKHADTFENSGLWEEEINPDGKYESARDFFTKHPDRINELTGMAFVLLDDPMFIEQLKINDFDGAIHGAFGSGVGTEFKVFDSDQVSLIGDEVASRRDEDVPSTGSTARKAGLAAGALALAPTTVEAATGAAKAAGATIAGIAVGDLISVASGIAFTSSDRLLKGLNPIAANMHLLANDTRSKTMKRVAEMFNRLGGNTDAGAQETYHEERDANRRIFRNKLADAFEPLAKLSQDQIRALDITIARALAGEIPMPSGPVGQVVQNLQALSDELYTYLRQSGLELNYAQGYAIPHSFNAEAVAKDEQAFIDTAEQAYIDNNPKRIRSLQKYIQQIDQEAAQNGGFTQEMTDRKNAMLEEIKKLQVANPRQQAEDLAAAILSGAEGGDQSQGLILASNPRNQNRADFLKSRVFEHSARAMLREYFHNDPRHAWNNYIARATTLAEFSRRFGADGQTWNQLVADMRAEKVKEVDITRIKEMVLDAMGALTPAAQGSHAMANALLGLSNMSKLKSTFLTNFLEAQAQAIPGNLLDAVTAPVVMLKEFAAVLAELTPRQRALLKRYLRIDIDTETGNMELARITGLMDSAGVHNIMENSAYALDNKGDFREDTKTDRAARKISQATGRMAQAYGIEASENAKRAMGARYAAGRLDQHVSEFLRDNILARALKKVGYTGDAMTTRNEAIMRLRRAGVSDANMIAFGTWWEKARSSGKFNEMLADTTDPMAAMARKAIRMESARAMVNSNRAMKPGGERNKAISQDNFWGKAVMSFLNYPAAFREQVAKPMARDIKAGFRGSESEGGQATFFSPAERARMVARASAIPAMAISAAAFLALRVLALGDDEDEEELKKKTLLNHMIDGLSYTGLTGGKTEAVQRFRRGQLPPVIDEGVRLGKNFERESTQSNGKERAVTKSLTRSVGVPALQAGASKLPAPLATIADQALASKQFNDLVVDTVAGPAKEKKKAQTESRSGSRDSGRSSGRSDGR